MNLCNLRLMKYVLLLILFALGGRDQAIDRHPIHVSVSEMDYNPETHHVEVGVRIFVDDLEHALETEGAPTLRLGTSQEAPKARDYLLAYLRQHLRVEANGKALPMDFVGYSVNQEVTWCFVEVKDLPSDQEALRICNTVLLDAFDDQTNIVYFRSGGKQTNLLLRKGEACKEVKIYGS